MIVVGIDPGKHTGVATWDTDTRALISVASMLIHDALFFVQKMASNPGQVLVIFEDNRLLRMHGGRMQQQEDKYGGGVREGVGSVKRDCSIWEDFLESQGIAYKGKLPQPKATKWSAEKFKHITQWPNRTNNHARDAAVIVYGLNTPMAEGIVRAWEQRSANTTGKSSGTAKSPASRASRLSLMRAGGYRTRY